MPKSCSIDPDFEAFLANVRGKAAAFEHAIFEGGRDACT
jgi:hypothetical protein